MIGDVEFWRGRKVLVTGHTGFKGVWLCRCLRELGAHVSGLSLEPDTDPSMFDLLKPWSGLDSRVVDVRDRNAVNSAIEDIRPEIVFHLAAQALVRRSYRDPLYTMETNVMGTANVLNALIGLDELMAVLVITSDKVYRNMDTGQAFSEAFPLGGDDPYSASKAATEMVSWSWGRSFFDKLNVPLATARAGNVLGGGDFSEDRLVPDAWRAVQEGTELTLRFPDATRPWQHVLDLTAGYIRYVEAMAGPRWIDMPRSLNFGPRPEETMTVKEIAVAMLDALGRPDALCIGTTDMQEKLALSIDPSLAKRALGWQAKLGMQDTIEWTAQWYKRFAEGEDPAAITDEQIQRYSRSS